MHIVNALIEKASHACATRCYSFCELASLAIVKCMNGN